MNKFRLLLFVQVFIFLVSCSNKYENNAVIKVDCSKKTGTSLDLTGYFNNSLRKAPLAELAALVEKQFGKPKITRCWLTLDDMWDYRTDEYRFNFQIGKDYYPGDTVKNTYKSKNPMGLELESDILYEDYITSFSKHSEELALNVRRYETEVLNGVLTIEKWQEVFENALMHYKQLCPNLVYIEVLNESDGPHFGGVPDDKYYLFFKAAWKAVNTVNEKLQPEKPLLVGGPSNHYEKDFAPFFEAYSKDSDPDKRLDFITYHEYGAQENPTKFAQHQAEVKAKLNEFGLDENLPQFITEMGYKGRTTEKWEDNFIQAAFVTSAIYHARNSEKVTIFPWVLYHTYRQTSHVMYTDELKLTPFGFAMQMLTLHADKEIYASSDSLYEDGTGVGVLASMDEDKLVIEIWNYSEKPFSGDMLVQSLPESLADAVVNVKVYRIDKTHNNAYQSGSHNNEMSFEVLDIKAGKNLTMEASLEPMSLVIWEIFKK